MKKEEKKIQYDLYNPIMHIGNLPVRVLSYNFLDSFENITPDFKEDIKGEINYNGLQAGIKYHFEEKRITNVACINCSKQIELYENFNQYLWCICYSLFVVFDESIQKPILENRYTGKIDLENPYVKQAIEVFNNGLDLIHMYKNTQFFMLPNPEKYNESEKDYVEKTNAIYTAAMTFILLHEFAHQYLGHLEYNPTNSEESKTDENNADDYAIDKIAQNFSSEFGTTYKCGIIAGVSSLILLDKYLNGGDTHPDLDDRLKNAIEKIQLEDFDNLWGFASLTFRLWTIKYNIEIEYSQIFENYKELFRITLEKVNEIKNNR